MNIKVLPKLHMKFIVLISLLFIEMASYGQMVEEFDYSKYPAKVSANTKKAALKIKSNLIAKGHEKEIIEGYQKTEINYCGHYVVILWNCGEYCVNGAMVDTRTGVIYAVPINVKTSTNKCLTADDVFDRYLFLPNSRLLITSICGESKNKTTNKLEQSQVFFVNLWDEKLKKFVLLKKKTKSRTI